MVSESPVNQWTRREVRRIPPFPESPHSLAECTFAPLGAFELSLDPIYYFERTTLQESLEPRFEFHVNDDALRTDTAIDLSDLDLVVSVRDFAARRSQVLGRWRVSEAPLDWHPDTSSTDLRNYEGVTFSISVCLSRQLPPSTDRAWRLGSTVANKAFSVRPETDTLGFPVVSVDFSRMPRGKDALWIIDFYPDADLSRPAEEILRVMINKDAEPKLREIMSRSPAGSILGRAMASEIFLEIATYALGRNIEEEGDVTPETDEGQGLVSQVAHHLAEVSGLAVPDLQRLAQAEEPSQLRAYVQALFGLNQALTEFDLRKVTR